MNWLSRFVKNIRTLNADDVVAFWVVYIMGPLIIALLISLPFAFLYTVLKIVTPSEIVPNFNTDFKNISIVKYKEIDKRNKDNRLFRITFKRDINKNESDSYISELNKLNNNRFEFSDIQKFFFLRRDIEAIDSLETTIILNCNTGNFSTKYKVYKNKNTDVLRDYRKDEILFAKNYSEIDGMALELCSESRKEFVY